MARSENSATQEKDLLAGDLLWTRSAHTHVSARKLSASLKTGVVVVGAGVSGAFMAHALAKRFGDVVIVDRRAAAHGSTCASTALLQFEIDTPLLELRDKMGAKAARAWRRSYRATQDLIALVQGENIRCGLARRRSLYLAGDRVGGRGLHAEAKARHRIGLPGEFLDSKTLKARFGIDRTGAILSPGSAVANPVQLTAGLLRRALKNGARFFSPVRIVDVLATAHGVVLDTGAHFIEAKHVVFCTGYEQLKGLPKRGTKITSSWAIASRPRAHYPPWLDETVVWEASDPYLYMRTTPDGRLVAGGEDEDSNRPAHRARSIPRKSAQLLRKAKALMPGLEISVSHRWTGAFGESEDGLPIIDAVPGMPGCFVVLGFGGNGTIYSMIASQIVPSLLKGRPDRDTEVFRFRD
ncbi:MAG TPA: FAD-dependent oxidoreductase [Rhizomicrobium sp.]|jgi:glycine/D-amino acid oxidase-like deaminating enzyme